MTKPPPLTREAFKELLKSPANIKAKAAIDCIKARKPLQELKALVEGGANQCYVERDPRHPRSAYLTHYVLAATFESGFGVVGVEKGEGFTTTELGVTFTAAPVEYFRYLMEKGFQAGPNNWRGDFLGHIMKCCFYDDEPKGRRQTARDFAKVMVDLGFYDIQRFADNDYAWNKRAEDMDFLISLGASPKGSGMIDVALNYFGCSCSGKDDTYERRAGVIRELLHLGAVPKKNLGAAISWQHIRYEVEQNGLLDVLADHGVIEREPSTAYLDWLQSTGKPLPVQ